VFQTRQADPLDPFSPKLKQLAKLHRSLSGTHPSPSSRATKILNRQANPRIGEHPRLQRACLGRAYPDGRSTPHLEYWLYKDATIEGAGWVAFYDGGGPVSSWRDPGR